MSALFALFLFLPMLSEQNLNKDRREGPIAVSGGAEIVNLQITRTKAAYAAKAADLSNMSITVWFRGEWESNEWPTCFLVKLVELDPIYDDIGTRLDSEKRRAAIHFLNREVIVGYGRSQNQMMGPLITLELQLPNRTAHRIRKIKGKAEVSRYKLSTLKFDNVVALDGKVLDHPKLKGFQVRPSFEVDEDETAVSLRVGTGMARVVDWWLEEKGQELQYTGESTSLINGKVVPQKTFRGTNIRAYSLVISLAEPIETKKFEFGFNNVELP